jgi:hypothetical protein
MSAAVSEWGSNGSSIINSFGEEARNIYSVIALPYTKTTKVIPFSASSTLSAGTVVLTIDGKSISTDIEAGTTLADAVKKINEWRFEDYSDWSNKLYNENSIAISYTKNTAAPDVSIEFDGGTTGLTMGTITDASATENLYYYYTDYTFDNWGNTSHWTRLYQWFPSYSIVKGAIEILQSKFPNARIIMWCPGAYNILEQDYTSSFNINDFYANDEEYKKNRERQQKMKEIAEYYHIECIDVDAECGITPKNFTQFYNFNNVHPKAAGYKRWGEVIGRYI